MLGIGKMANDELRGEMKQETGKWHGLKDEQGRWETVGVSATPDWGAAPKLWEFFIYLFLSDIFASDYKMYEKMKNYGKAVGIHSPSRGPRNITK